MPESVTDRPTKSHEYVFLLSKQARYYYDSVAIAEDAARGTRNARSVWTIATQPLKLAHFAVMPPKLAERCILAGTSAKGACAKCGAPWERVTERTGHVNQREPAHAPNNCPTKTDSTGWAPVARTTDGWRPTCACPGLDGDSPGSDCADDDNWPVVPCKVLDPFGGAGTTAKVALEHRRDFVIIELNPTYAAMAIDRTDGVQATLL